MCSAVIRIGTRKSKLAMKQATMVAELLKQRYPDKEVCIIGLSTPGDLDKTTPLSELGGKGVFISTLETALLQNEIDIAVHSLKDVTSATTDKLKLTGFLKPEACEDVLIVNSKYQHDLTLETLPQHAKIGTGSLRRKGLIKELRPDCICIDIRGNVETRLNRCEDDLDAVVLSKAGLLRLGLESKISETLDPQQFVPAPGQGVIVLQTRTEDTESEYIAISVSDRHQTKISEIEMTLLNRLGLGCQFPFGTYTRLDGETIEMICFIADESLSKRRYLRRVWQDIDTPTTLATIFHELSSGQ